MATPGVSSYFDAGTDAFVSWLPKLWDPLGAALVELAAPLPGELVLDVCCGAGSSALLTAESVGATGHVDALDLAEGLLAYGRERAEKRGLLNVEFVSADALTWPKVGYDLIQSGFGVFFLPRMDQAVDRLIELLKPGGRFAVTTWCGDSLKELFEPFFAAVGEHRPEALSAPVPEFSRNSERLCHTDVLRDWLVARGLSDVAVIRHEHTTPLDAARGWQLVMSGPTQLVLAGADDDERQSIKDSFARHLAAAGTVEMQAPCHVGVGTLTRT